MIKHQTDAVLSVPDRYRNIEVALEIAAMTIIGKNLKKTHPELQRSKFSQQLVLALRDSFLTMEKNFTSDVKTLQSVAQLIPKDGVVKVGSREVVYSETNDLKAVFFPPPTSDPYELERLGTVWDWNKPAIRTEMPKPNLVERALLFFMQVPQADKRLECLRRVNEMPETLAPVQKSLAGLKRVAACVDSLIQNRSFVCLLRGLLSFGNWCNFIQPGDSNFRKMPYGPFRYGYPTIVRSDPGKEQMGLQIFLGKDLYLNGKNVNFEGNGKALPTGTSAVMESVLEVLWEDPLFEGFDPQELVQLNMQFQGFDAGTEDENIVAIGQVDIWQAEEDIDTAESALGLLSTALAGIKYADESLVLVEDNFHRWAEVH